MIFNNNSTVLAGGSIAMAEGYDGTCGAALALVEGARNDFAMFQAMLGVESREIQIRRESAGYVNEGEIRALAEAAAGGIWSKIKELFSKLIAKIKGIFHVFMSKLNSLVKSDKEMVKKYEKEILRKSNIGKMEVSWRKIKKSPIESVGTVEDVKSIDAMKTGWDESSDVRYKNIGDLKVEPDEHEEKRMEEFFDDDSASTYELSEVGGIRPVLTYLSAFDGKMKGITNRVNKIATALDKLVKDANKKADASTSTTNDKGEKVAGADADITAANHVYDMAVAYQNYTLKDNQIVMEAIKIEYKQNKAAFMKAIAANDKKLEESAVYLNAVAEAAEQEVEDVIDGAIGDIDLSTTNNASLNVLDPGTSDDPDKLTYAEDKDYDEAKTSGSVKSSVNSKEEAAFFGAPLY